MCESVKVCRLDLQTTFQLAAVLAPGVRSLANLPYADCVPEKSDIEYKDGQIISAPLETLVDMLRPGASRSFAFTLLLCSRLFIKPHELLGKLCKRYFKNYEKIVSVSFLLDFLIARYARELHIALDIECISRSLQNN